MSANDEVSRAIGKSRWGDVESVAEVDGAINEGWCWDPRSLNPRADENTLPPSLRYALAERKWQGDRATVRFTVHGPRGTGDREPVNR